MIAFLIPLLLPTGITGTQRYAESTRLGMKPGPQDSYAGTIPTWLCAQLCVHSKGPCATVPRCRVLPLGVSPTDSSALASPLLGLQMCGFWGLRSSRLHGGHTINRANTQHSWSVFLSTGSHYFLRMPWNSQCSPGWPQSHKDLSAYTSILFTTKLHLCLGTCGDAEQLQRAPPVNKNREWLCKKIV